MLPAAARWYLAGIAVFGLLCVAMQLSIQDHAQQQAKTLVQAWGARANVHIGDVRYHLLRNGLILRGIRIERGDDSIAIAQMLLRANPKLLTGDAPRIGVIDISGLRAQITRAGQADDWKHELYLKQIWQAATALTVHDGHIQLYVNGTAAPALELRGVSIRQRLQYGIRSIEGSARIQQGGVNWRWQMQVGSESPPAQTTHWRSKGRIQWQRLDAGELTASMALKQITGHLSGDLAWETHSPGNVTQQSVRIHGEMQLDTGTDSEATDAHHVQFKASEAGGRWQMDIDATAWPLDPWSDALPKLGERQLIAAQVDGKTHWQGHPGDWDIESDNGFIQDVTYARPDSSASPAWYWSRIHYKRAAIHTARHQLQVDGLDMLDSRLVLQTKRRDESLAGNAAPEAVWDINADQINVRNMMLALALPQGKVTLESLDGQVHSPKGKALRFKLHTHTENNAQKNTAAADEQGRDAPPQWRLRGSTEKNSRGQLISASINIRGQQIPVASLRPLLPMQDDADRPVKLTGRTDFRATVSVNQGQWQMQGKAEVRNLNLVHGGDVLLADQVSMRFGPVGMGLESQSIDSIQAQGWQYIAALHPLALHVAEQSDNDHGPAGGAAWWVTTLRHNHIAIDQLHMEDGQISVGQRQALWAEHVHISMAGIQDAQWSDITATAAVGGSDFKLTGQWQALSDTQRFRGDVSLQQAEPFFLHNWMAASGMPRLIQGRLSASLHLQDGQVPDSYQGTVQCQLLQGVTETGIFTSDPMLPRTGYSTPELLQRLEQSPGVIALQYDLSGLWSEQALTLERLGLSMQEAMHEAAQAGSWREQANVEQSVPDVAIQARIRLHGRERLSLNERNRLSGVVHGLRKHPERIIFLRPKWKGPELTAETQQRIRRTQQLIEKYMTHRHIDKSRIFPVWPTAGDQVAEIGSVQVETGIAGG